MKDRVKDVIKVFSFDGLLGRVVGWSLRKMDITDLCSSSDVGGKSGVD